MTFKTLFRSAVAAVLALTSCSGNSAQGSDSVKSSSKEEAPSATVSVSVPDNHKAIVCYFSATGTTAEQAKRIATITGADIYEITPEQGYTDEDLDWRNENSRSSVEMKDSSARPALKSKPDLSQYDIVYIGYPNWWNTAPRIINTFIESADFTGKTIVPFMTSGGSDIVNSEKDLTTAYPTLTFAKGLLMNNVTDDDIAAWATSSMK